jgi:hypothetical protein
MKAEQWESYKKSLVLSGYLARIEHFALGVNTKIYDAKTAERAGTNYLVYLYRIKLAPMIKFKEQSENMDNCYNEFKCLIEKLEKLEKNKKVV